VLWPGAALLGLVLPLSLLERTQSYLHYLAPTELWGVLATTVLMCLPFALLLTLATVLLQAGVSRLPAALRERIGGATAAASLLFIGVLAFGLHYALAAWLTQVGSAAWAAALPQLRWVIGGAMLLAAFWVGFRHALDSLRGAALGLSAVGLLALLSLPLLGWPDTRPAPAAPAGAAAPTRPHVVLLTLDTLSAGHMSLYGYRRNTTPELDRFAAQGVAFERFYATSNYTTPTIASMMTGVLPTTHQANQLMSWPLPRYRRDSLPAVLQRANYTTYAVSTNPLAGPNKNGLGAYFDQVASDRIYTYFSGRDGPSRWLRYLGPALDNPLINSLWRPTSLARWAWGAQQAANRHYDPELAFADARAMVESHTAGPLFLWVHLLPPHSPYAAPSPFLGQFDGAPAMRDGGTSSPPFMFAFASVPPAVRALYEARYDESLRYVDAHSGDFLRWVRQRLGPNTVILVSADHGESFAPAYGGHAGPLLSEALVRIPLLAQGPGFVAGRRVAEVSSQIDLAPTIAELAGAPAPADWQGRSLTATLRGTPDTVPRTVWSMNFEQSPRGSTQPSGTLAAIGQRWKSVRPLGTLRYPGMPPAAEALYDLENDPGELNNLAGAPPAEARALRAEIDRFVAAMGPAPR